ncbi:MAG: hypothetical protein ACXVIG_07375 [Halobacteriota archaeon]
MAPYDYNAQRYYPHEGPITVSNGQWHMNAFFGSDGTYDIVVFTANDTANAGLLNYQKQGSNEGIPPLEGGALPVGWTELARITVIKP